VTHSAEQDDDWAPLPAETVATQESRKADREHRKQIAVPAPAVRPVGKHKHVSAEVTASAPSVELAEVALLQLRERIAKQQKDDTPVQQAFRKASKRPEQTLMESARSNEIVAPPAPTECTDQSVAIQFADRDPREGMPWFVALPQSEQERLRAQWSLQRQPYEEPPHARSARRRMFVLAGLIACFSILLTALGLMMRGFMPTSLWPAWIFCATLAAAFVGSRMRGGYILFFALGLASYAVAMGSAIYWSPNLLFALFVHGGLMAFAGLDQESLRSGGFCAAHRLAVFKPQPRRVAPKQPADPHTRSN
jgi:hypothetical protein